MNAHPPLRLPQLAALLLLSLSLPVFAQTRLALTIPALDFGSYDVHGDHDAREPNASAGKWGPDGGRTPVRNWFAFSVPSFEGTVTNARLHFQHAYLESSQHTPETFQLHHVATSVEVLRRGGFGLRDIYADLADGAVYGSREFEPSHYGVATIALNDAFMSAVAAARGQDIALGGHLTTLNDDSNFEYLMIWQLEMTAWLELEILAPQQPLIHTQPRVGFWSWYGASILVGASGANLNFHWSSNGVPLAMETDGELFVSGLALGTPHEFAVVVSNSLGVATSDPVRFTVPVGDIYLPFTNVAVRAGEQLTVFPVVRWLPVDSVTLEWWKDGTNLVSRFGVWPGFPAPLIFGSAATNDSGDYTLVLSNSFGAVTSAVLRINVVETPPVWWQQPANLDLPLGSSAAIRVDTRGGPAPVVRWYHNGNPICCLDQRRLDFSALGPGGVGSYYATASNHLGVITSRVATVSTYLDPPVFVSQPADQVVYPRTPANFNVGVTGSPYPSFQWYFNGAPILNARANWLTVMDPGAEHAGSYFCVASNASGVATSAVATLQVLYVPPVLGAPEDASVLAGQRVYFNITVSNPFPAPAFQWQFDGRDIPGATNEWLSVGSPDTNHVGEYRVIATNPYGSATSVVARLAVRFEAPTFQLTPVDQEVTEGATARFYSWVNGGPPPQVFLQRNGTNLNIPFESGRFRIPEITRDDEGEYRVVAMNSLGAVTSAVARLTVRPAGPFDLWTRRNPIPNGRTLLAVAHGAERFVAVGENGTILSSTDGTNWLWHGIRTAADLRGVAFGNGIYVAVGDGGSILTSSNGTHWVLRRTADHELFAVGFGAGRFVAVGDGRGIEPALVSTNGIDWSERNIGFGAAEPMSVAYHPGGRFVVVGDEGLLADSPDGANWTMRTPFTTLRLEAVAVGGSRAVAVGNNGVAAFSDDGETWTTIPAITLRRLLGLVYARGRYVAVGTRGVIFGSSDGATWSAAASATPDRLESVAAGDELFVAVGENGTIVTSYDGVTWANQTRGTRRDLDGIAVGGGQLIVVGKSGTILTSTNGSDFVEQNSGVAFDLHGAAFGQDKYVVVGKTTNVLVSSNAVDWVQHSFPGSADSYLKAVTFGVDHWIAVGVHGEIYRSPDAVAWSAANSGTFDDLQDVTFGNGLFIAVGDDNPPNGTILSSVDGITWLNRSVTSRKNNRAIAYGNERFVIGANDGRMLYASSDDMVWRAAATGITGDGDNLRSITYSNGLWVAVGNDGMVLASEGASTWQVHTARTGENLHGVRYINGTFVAIGNRGTILQSQPMMPRLAVTRAGSNLRFRFTDPFVRTYRLQASGDLRTWSDIGTLTNTSGAVEFSDAAATTQPQRFYRAVSP